MKTNTIVGLIVAGIVIFFGIIYFSMSISYNNKEVTLRNLVNAQIENNKANYDKVWKTISQTAQISESYRQSFDSIYTKIISSRYENDNSLLFKFVTESNPQFDTKILVKLAETVQSGRDEFYNEQKKLIDYNRERDNLIMTFPGSLFCSNKEKIDIHLVTSSKTKEVFKTGEENDIDLGLGKDK